jgi:hypothetical protein
MDTHRLRLTCVCGRTFSDPNEREEHQSKCAVIRVRRSGKRTLVEATLAAEAHARLNAGNVAAEEERFGPFPCCERDTDGDGNCDRHPVKIRPFTPEEIEALDAYNSREDLT